MSQLLLQNSKTKQPFCNCCLETNVPYISLLACTHSNFLDSFEKPELKPLNQLVCYQCHELLKKIKLFKLQVEESFKLLRNQHIENIQSISTKSNHKLNHLKLQHRTVDISIPQITENNFENIISFRENGAKIIFDKNQSYEVKMAPDTAMFKTENRFVNQLAESQDNKQIIPLDTTIIKKENDFEIIFSENLNNKKRNAANIAIITTASEFENTIINDSINNGQKFTETDKKRYNSENSLHEQTNNRETSSEIDIDYENAVFSLKDENISFENDDLKIAQKQNNLNGTKNDNLPKSTNGNEDKKIRNIQKALNIINKNTNDNCINLLVNSIQAIASSNFGNITEVLSENLNIINDASLLSNTGVPTEEETPLLVDVEMEDVVEDGDSQEGLAMIKSNIKKVKLSKKQLEQERLDIAQSASYLDTPHRCESCLIGFHYKENLSDHIKRKHTPKSNVVSCDICQQVIHPYTPESYSLHKSRHYFRYQCLCCNKRFGSFPDAVQHYKREHMTNRTIYKCKKCDFNTHLKLKLRRHTLKNHSSFSCKNCKETFSSRRLLKEHVKSCKTKMASAKGQVKRRPVATKLYRCKYCKGNIGFKDDSNLQIHLMREHRK